MIRKWIITCVFTLATAVFGDVRLPAIISNGMVLQQGTRVPIWGWAGPGEQVTVSFAGQSESVTVGEDGCWKLALKPLAASAEPAILTVKGANTVTVEDVLVGEVWFCSGQSNMAWSMNRITNAEAEISNANNPLIRHFKITKTYSFVPETNVGGAWGKTASGTIARHSAVAYMFGRRLHAVLDNVPVGLINSSWGSTRIEPWTPLCGFTGIPALDNIRQKAEAADAFESGGRHARQQPTVLYNGMVAGIVPYAVKGAIWYQGESNRGDGLLYLEKTKALVNGWRTVWNLPDLPFYMVQLAPFTYGGDAYALPEIWEAQATAAKTIPNTGLAVINDIGTLNDIHPPNKQDVGLRLANQALNRTYGHNAIEWSGPVYKSYAIEDHAIRIAFDYAQGLKTRDGEAPDWFELCGADGTFAKAAAVIDGETVVITSTTIPQPTGFRFAWHQLAEPNLTNRTGLPTGAFRDGKHPLSQVTRIQSPATTPRR